MRVRRLRLRLRVRGRRPLIPCDLDTLQAFYKRQDAWFADTRYRLLRNAGIARRRRVLDLGSGTGETLAELRRRARGMVVALDADMSALSRSSGMRAGAHASRLPFAEAAFDLVFTQMFFLWARPLDEVLGEVRRVLKPGGVLVVCAEPDYGGVVSVPGGALGSFIEQLSNDGADPEVGRKLGGELNTVGFKVVDAGVHPANPLAVPDDAPGADAEFLFVPCFYFLAEACR